MTPDPVPAPVPLLEQIRAHGVRIADTPPEPHCVCCVDRPGVDPAVPFLLCACREKGEL